MKEGKTFKRILAIVLVVLMTISAVPFGVFAADAACEHNYKRVNENNATCTADGNKAHYKCEICEDLAFSNGYDENGNLKFVSTTIDKIVVKATGHTGGTATCIAQAVCDTCEQPYGEFAAHTWNAGSVTTQPTCVATGVKTFACTVEGCTATKTEDVEKSEEHAWEATKTVDKVASCKEKGLKSTHCSLCDATKDPEEIEKTEHDYEESVVAPTCYAKGYTLYECKNCGEKYTTNETDTVPHTFDAGTVTTEATCIEKGVKTFKCTTEGCTETKTEEIPLAAHKGESIPEVEADCTTAGSKGGTKCSVCQKVLIEPTITAPFKHDLEKFAAVSPTCTTEGKTAGEKCTREGCDYEVKQETITALGHDLSKDKKTVVEPTCTTQGVKAYICTREGCAYVQEDSAEAVAMLEHKWSDKALITKEATCTANGSKAVVCNDCKSEKAGTVEVITALGHDWDEGTVKDAATCQKDGTTTFKCKRTGCGVTEDRKVNKIDHDYNEVVTQPTCEADGYTTKTCKMCGEVVVDDKQDKFGHRYVTYVYDDGSATCYSDGTKTALCDNGCGKKNTVADEGPMVDHELTDYTTTKEATCTEGGQEEAKCFYYDKCGYSEGFDTDPLGHTITAETPFTVDVAATCTEAGSQSKHCERCTYTEGTEVIPALDHDYQPDEGTKATCLEGGYIKYTCTRCADSYDVDDGPALGHKFAYVYNEGSATCVEDGNETGKCERCEVVDTRTAAGTKLDHTLGEPVVTPATMKADGVITKTCTMCNDYAETENIAKVTGLKLKYTSVAYDGKYKRPGLTITDANGTKLVKGEDYTLELPAKDECIDVGTYTYVVTFIGDYEGETTVSYKVLPGKTSKITAKTTRQSYITLKWSAVKGADGYRVYYKSSNGKWKTLAKNVKGTTYKVENLKAAKQYTFAVKAYTKVDGVNYWAASYTQQTFTTLPAKTSKIAVSSANSKAIKLTWNKVSGADGYRVYIYNTKTGKYKALTTTTKTTYTVTGLKANTTYKFAVKAYLKYDKTTYWSNQYTTFKAATKK